MKDLFILSIFIPFVTAGFIWRHIWGAFKAGEEIADEFWE